MHAGLAFWRISIPSLESLWHLALSIKRTPVVSILQTPLCTLAGAVFPSASRRADFGAGSGAAPSLGPQSCARNGERVHGIGKRDGTDLCAP